MIGIVNYEGGNLASVACAVEHLGYHPVISSDPEQLTQADKIIFPGVGAAGATMDALKKASLIDVLKRDLKEKGTPCLGICIGIQVLFEHSEEDDVDTLGIVSGQVLRFPEGPGIKVPHIGWNTVHFSDTTDPLLKGVSQDDYFYFVNSYYVAPENATLSLGKTTYAGVEFTSLIKSENWYASQFHLEKSGRSGLKLLENFLNL